MATAQASADAPAAHPPAERVCTKCGRNPRAIVRKKGKRMRAKMCATCIRETIKAAPRTQAAELPRRAERHESTEGHESPNLCGARKRNGKPCSAEAGKGTSHPGIGRCKHHGGSTPMHLRQAAKMIAQHHALVMGAPEDIEPHEALLWCVRIAAGEVSYCNLMVAQLAPTDVVGSPVSVKTRPESLGKDGENPENMVDEITRGTPALHIWINTRRDAIDRLAKFSKLALDAGVAERQIALSERWGEMLGRVIGNILDGLRLTDEQQRRAPELVRTHLTAIESTAREVA